MAQSYSVVRSQPLPAGPGLQTDLLQAFKPLFQSLAPNPDRPADANDGQFAIAHELVNLRPPEPGDVLHLLDGQQQGNVHGYTSRNAAPDCAHRLPGLRIGESGRRGPAVIKAEPKASP